MSVGDLALPIPDETHPRAGIRVRRRRELQLIASQQGGYFTVSQATQAGYDRRARHHHLSYGNWRRTIAPGVYRLSGSPPTDHEALHAWLLWAGVGAALTSWTVLNVHGHSPPTPTATDLRVVGEGAGLRTGEAPDVETVHIVRPRATGRLSTSGSAPNTVRFHTGWDPHRPAELLHDLVVRPLDEALCIALNTSVGRRAAWVADLTETLLDSGRLELVELLETAREAPSPPMLDLLWPRLRRRLGTTG